MQLARHAVYRRGGRSTLEKRCIITFGYSSACSERDLSAESGRRGRRHPGGGRARAHYCRARGESC